MNFKSLITTTASVIAVASMGVATAQDDTDERESAVDRVLGVVTVTATKKADVENVQDVPIAITAFNSDTLDALNVTTLESLSYTTPNVSLDDIGTARGTANFAVRGLGVNSSIPSIDPAVGVFIDGVYLGVNNGVVVDLFDLDSVEIARGPQGLLFGRNTTGGALIINTANPTDEFSYKLRTTLDGPVDSDRGGTNGTVQAIVSGPLVQDVLNGKIGVYYNSDAGYFKNLANGENHGEAQTTLVRGALDFTPTSDFRVLAKAEYSDTRSDGPSGQNRGVYSRDTFNIAINNDGFAEAETLFGSIRADLDVEFGDGTITNIIGYRDYDSGSSGDIDALPITIFHSGAEFTQEQISNELRYAGTFGKADVTTGLYYFNQEILYTETRNIPSTRPATLPATIPWAFYGGGTQDHTVYGVFGQVDYEFTDKLTGIFGLRWSQEEKDGAITFIRPRNQCSVVGGTCPTSGTNDLISLITGGLAQEPNGFVDSDEWSNLTPKVGFQYFYDDRTQFYGSYTKGFRSGGYNFRITDVPLYLTQLGLTGKPSFDEEEVDAFELGRKWESADRRALFNLSWFRNEISNMQREVNISAGPASVNQFILNTADATITGLEAEGRYAVADNLLITGNLGLLDAEYDDVRFDISNDGQLTAGDAELDLPRAPEITWGVGALYDLDLKQNGAVTVTANYQYRDRIAYTDSNLGWIQEADILTADVTWDTPVDGLAVSVFGNNLLDEVQAGNDTQLSFGGAFAGFAPGGQNLSTGQFVPFAENPAGGTFSPLKKGRVVGIELTLVR